MEDKIKNIEESLLIKYIAGNTNENEAERIKNWLNSDSENQKRFKKLEKIWKTTQEIQNYNKINVEESLKNVKQRINSKETKSQHFNFNKILRIAALVTILIAPYYIYKFVSQNQNAEIRIVQSQSNKQEIKLADATEISLNSNSKISFPKEFNDSIRKVEFEGEAYFKIAKNKAKPFVIETSKSSEVRILGTQFNLKTQKSDNQELIFVTEGKVLFSSKQKDFKPNSIILIKGEKGIIDFQNKTISKESITDSNFMAWKTGVLEFENILLPNALKQIEAHYKINFEIINNEFEEYELSAKYDNLKIDELIEIMEITINAKIEKQDNKYIIR